MRRVCKAIFTFLFHSLLLVGAAYLASLAFPSKHIPEGLPFLAFFYLIPVFYVIFQSKYQTVWFYGLLYGFTFYLFYNYWLETFHPLAILIAPTLESVQYVLLFLVLRSTKTIFRKHYGLAAGLIYNAYLYLTQNGFLAYPYGNLTSAVYEYASLIQIVSITGIWGLGLLMTMPQTVLAEMLDKKKWKEYLPSFVAVVLALLLTWGIGDMVKRYYAAKEPERVVRIAAIQHSADTWKGGYSTYKENFYNLMDLTKEAMAEDPEMVVWSETAFVPSVTWHRLFPMNNATDLLCLQFEDFGKTLGIPLITGNPEGIQDDPNQGAINEEGDWNWKTFNTVIYFGEGEVLGTYRKQHLVPFTEYFPYQKQFPRLYALLKANDYKWWEKGEEPTVFDYDGIHFSTPICFEDMFGVLNAEFVRQGADVLLNLSNDFWSQAVQAETQHLQLAIFRAVETRRPLLRSTNSGITCLVLPSGEIVDPLEPFTMSWGIYDVPLGKKHGITFYTAHPDVFGKGFVLFSMILLTLGIFQKAEVEKREKEEAALMERYAYYEACFASIDDRYEC